MSCDMFDSAKRQIQTKKIIRGQKALTVVSVILGILTVLFLAMTREAYAISVSFLLVVIKGMLMLKYAWADK